MKIKTELEIRLFQKLAKNQVRVCKYFFCRESTLYKTLIEKM